jgi:hypothetical protein
MIKILALCLAAALIFTALAWRSTGNERPAPTYCAHCGQITVVEVRTRLPMHAATSSVTCAPYDLRMMDTRAPAAEYFDRDTGRWWSYHVWLFALASPPAMLAVALWQAGVL